jgi:hypothetical protein
MGDGFTHMEWFYKPKGEVVFGEIGCRPGGAHLVDQMNYTCDIDLFREWARVVCWHAFEARPTRKYNVGSSSSAPSGRAASPDRGPPGLEAALGQLDRGGRAPAAGHAAPRLEADAALGRPPHVPPPGLGHRRSSRPSTRRAACSGKEGSTRSDSAPRSVSRSKASGPTGVVSTASMVSPPKPSPSGEDTTASSWMLGVRAASCQLG